MADSNIAENPSSMLKLVVMLVIGVIVLGLTVQFAVAGFTGSEEITYPGTSEHVLDTRTVDGDAFVNVLATTGEGVVLDGDGHVDVPGPLNMTPQDGFAAAAAGSTPAENASMSLVAYNNSSILLMYDSGTWLAHYDNGTHDATVTLPANKPGELTPVMVMYRDGTGLLLAAENNVSSPVPLTQSESAYPQPEAWNGTVDEVRFFSSSPPNATAKTYMNDPVAPLPNTDETARVMFDENSGDTAPVYWADTTATVTNGAWGDGAVNPSGKISAGNDYVYGVNPLTVQIANNGYLAGAPVVHASWEAGLPLPLDLSGLIGVMMALYLVIEVASRVMNEGSL